MSSGVTLRGVLFEGVMLKEHVRVLGHMHHIYSSPVECMLLGFFMFVFPSGWRRTLQHESCVRNSKIRNLHPSSLYFLPLTCYSVIPLKTCNVVMINY